MTKWLGTSCGHRFSTFFHIGALLHHIFVMYYMNFISDPSKYVHKYQYIWIMAKFSYRFFTSWNFIMQFWYFSLCIAHDILQMTDSEVLLKTKEKVMHLRNYTFRTFAFPMAFTVSIVFWSLFTLDRSFIFPSEAELVVSSWCNHAIHTNVVILMLVEIATTRHDYSNPASQHSAMFGITVLYLLYFCCYMGTYVQHGVWLYPIHNVLNWPNRILLIIFCYILTMVLFFCGERLSIKIWGNDAQGAQDAAPEKAKIK